MNNLPNCGEAFGAVASQGFRHFNDGSVQEISRNGVALDNKLSITSTPSFGSGPGGLG